jgi:ABC-type multidrug transport system fused ATPase/permease subunit
MQVFSRDMIAENSQLAKSLTAELQQHHDRAIISLQMNHEAQVGSYEVLSGYMGDITNVADRINNTTNSSLTKIDNIEHRLDSISSKAEHIAKGFAFFSSLPQLMTSLIRCLILTVGAIFILVLLYKVSKKLATYTAGACSAAYLLHFCGIYDCLARLPARATDPHGSSAFHIDTLNLNATQKGVGVIMLLWFGTYPVSRINSAISHAFTRVLSSYWVRQYSNDGGMGLLPSVEIPRIALPRKLDAFERCIGTDYSHPVRREAS